MKNIESIKAKESNETCMRNVQNNTTVRKQHRIRNNTITETIENTEHIATDRNQQETKETRRIILEFKRRRSKAIENIRTP